MIAHNEGFGESVKEAIDKFMNNDWGEVCKEDAALNDKEKNNYAIGTYRFPNMKKFWIIFDGGATTVLLPEEY